MNLPFAAKQFLSPDASLYLDATRNVASGRGAIVSFNQYQFWRGASHPLWAYTQPFFPLLAAVPFKLGGVRGVITFNIFLFAVNCGLVYLITRRAAGALAGFAAAMIAGFSYNAMYTAIYPWTEQLFLTIILGVFYIYAGMGEGAPDFFSCGKRYFWMGVLLGLSCLARAMGFYAGFIFFTAVLLIGGWAGNKRYGFFLLFGGFLAVTAGYEIFCLIKYHTFYPEYIRASLNYNNARHFPGAFYTAGNYALYAPPAPAAFLAKPADFLNCLKVLSVLFGPFLILLLIPLVCFAKGAWRYAGRLVKLIFCYGLLNFLMIIFFMEDMGLELMRLLLVPFITMIVGGVILIAREKRFLRIAFIPVVACCLIMAAASYFSFRYYMLGGYSDEIKARRTAQEPLYRWIEKNTRQGDVIAAQFIDEAFWLNRPVVALPLGAMVNEKNIRDFIRIYKPRYVLAQDERVIAFCRQAGFSDEIKSAGLLLLKKREPFIPP